MNDNKKKQEPTWEAPKIITIGIDITEAANTNVPSSEGAHTAPSNFGS